MPQGPQHRVPPEPEGEPALLVPVSQMDQELESQVSQGTELLERAAELNSRGWPTYSGHVVLRDDYDDWDQHNEQLLRVRFSTEKLANGYMERTSSSVPTNESAKLSFLKHGIEVKLRRLGSIRKRLELYQPVTISTSKDGSVSPRVGGKIFIVHGHDGDTKLQVARLIERITGERPVIFHEQADSGRTIIEKFEELASEAGFAIILLTADDEGNAKGATQLNPRARQNVMLEFGYFMAKLGRGRVVALHEAGVELPSDVSGVLYKSLAGNWHTELARELKAAGIDIDFSKLFS